MTQGSLPESTILHFAADASLLFQMGESLISDSTQALLELIKNSYDADATQVLVEVDANWQSESSTGTPLIGRVVITDNGTGMSMEEIQRGWLTLSGSPKRARKRAGWKSKMGRTPLGEKGLGRLGVQRLGSQVEIDTVSANEHLRHLLSYSWESFRSVKTLGEVDIPVTSVTTGDPAGTTIVVSGLYELNSWKDQQSLNRFAEGLSQLVSPYQTANDFSVDVIVNGDELALSRIGSEVLRAAHVHYDIQFNGKTLVVSGRAKLAFFRPPSGHKLIQFNQLVESDRGAAFLRFLNERTPNAEFALRPSKAKGWFVEFSTEVSLEDVATRITIGDSSAKPELANPGPFSGSVDAFDFGRDTRDAAQSVFSSTDAFRQYVQRFSGIRVYRNGFGIRTDRDWLALSAAATSGKSYYSLKPMNTMGYIAITAKDNPDLLEKTDREGFQVTPHYDNFVALLLEFVAFTDAAQSKLRREYLAFVRRHQGIEANVADDVTPRELAGQIRKEIARGAALRSSLESATETMLADIKSLTSSVDKAKTSADSSDSRAILVPISRRATALQSALESAASSWLAVSAHLERTSKLDPVSQLLEQQIADVEAQISALYETASLGITAEALSHELANIVEQLRTRAKAATSALKANQFTVRRANDFLTAVQASVAGIRKQLAHLAPSLRFARDERDVIALEEFLSELTEYHNERWKGNIEAKVLVTPNGDFSISFNRGKLVQVFDNLLLNSEFWLLKSQRKHGVVTIEIDQPFVRVFDSGPGVATHIEQSLFQPFVSGKPKGVGRGLGLFIVDRLLAADGCTIALGDERNANGRRFVFELNFAEAYHE